MSSSAVAAPIAMEWAEGDLVWFDPGLGHPLPGEVLEVHRGAQMLTVQAVINGKPQTFTLAAGEGNLRARQDLGLQGVEDMTQLEDLHEASLLWNLKLRYDRGLIYTFAGSILVAVNPYKMFPASYGLEVAQRYAGRPLGALPPHLFAISSAAHAALPAPQVVVISGESGAGKTESTKLVMQYLAAVAPAGGAGLVAEQILEAAPLLEAFGNARTARNDNSSRFGKYLEVFFKNGSIIGAKVTQYLLEKSRIVTQAPGERNYHVFYELLGGLNETERKKYGLLDAEKYFYLNQGAGDCAAGQSAADWSALQGAMQVLGVAEGEQEDIVKVLAACLHLGNVYFHRRQLRHGQEGVEVGSDAEIKWAAHLLQIPAEGLLRSLTARVTEARAERLHTPLGIDQALDARDAFAKALYSGLFSWLVSRVNSIVHRGGTHDAHRISILDIFGFEDLAENSFEQLCINYANESLQLYFNKHVFKLEQQEYTKERLEWTPLGWEDNLPVIHLLAKKPVGILHLLDDESNFPRATDHSFLEKCHYNHALNELYSRPRVGAQEFGVSHYAGQVWYGVEGFLEKNRDALRPDVLELLASSKQPLIVDMTRQLRAAREAGKALPRGANGRFVTMKPRTPTVAARFSDSLQQLLGSMSRCSPWFVRCVKPNTDKQALRMDMPCVLQQLRCLGMLDTIRIRQKGYPVRMRFQAFVERYRCLLESTPGERRVSGGHLPRGTPFRELCRGVLEAMPATGTAGPDFQLGATRVFMREALHRALEESRADRLRSAAILIQRHVRGLLARKRWGALGRSAILIQAAWRGHVQRSQYVKLKRGVVKAQALQRGKMQRKKYALLKTEMKRRQEAEKAVRARAAQRLSREQAERSPVIHLDVPAELAFIFSKLEGWQPPHTDRHMVKVLGAVPGPPNVPPLPKDLDQFSFGKFSSVYCNGMDLGVRRDPITAPFLSRAAARDQDFQDALAVFKLVLRWGGDASLQMQPQREMALADYIVHKGLNSRGLRDEILVQLCSQAWRNENGDRIWQLMNHCLSCFHPGPALNKYLMKFVSDHAPPGIREQALRKLLRPPSAPACRLFPPSTLEWRCGARRCDMALPLTLPDGSQQTVAVDSWTTCEEAAALAIGNLGIPAQGWTITFDDSGLLTDSCGLDYVFDLVAERELCPAFPAPRSDMLRTGHRATLDAEPSSPRRPQVPPPEPPSANKLRVVEEPVCVKRSVSPLGPRRTSAERPQMRSGYSSPSEVAHSSAGPTRKTSHDLLSRSSALNERYFEIEKVRSRSLDDLLAGGDVVNPNPTAAPLSGLGLSQSRLNDRYHSNERLEPSKPEGPRYVKSQYTGKRAAPGSHSSKAYIERSEMAIGGGAARSSAMSDTSEAPSLASHVRRVRVPSQASDVDQFLDELFSPVLDGSLDELSDARSLAASIRGSADFLEAPEFDDLSLLTDVNNLVARIKGGGQRTGPSSTASSVLDHEVAALTNPADNSLDEYITDLFQPIFVNDSLRRLTEKSELIGAIKGGGTTHQPGAGTSGFGFPQTPGVLSPPPLMMMGGTLPAESFMPIYNMQGMQMPQSNGDLASYQQQMQRAFLQSAMAQNIQIQQQLLAQNQALQTLLQSQQEPASVVPVMQESAKVMQQPPRRPSFKTRTSPSTLHAVLGEHRSRKASSDSSSSLVLPPPPPPMPPPLESIDPSEARPFLDPYGRAKTVRIGKWRWPPPSGVGPESGEDFMHFKMRQHQRKTTPQSQQVPIITGNSAVSGQQGNAVDWEEFEIESLTALHASKEGVAVVRRSTRRSFEIGAQRPPPGSVGKLKLSSEMRQRLEQVTAGHSVRSAASTHSDRPQRTPAKLEDARRMMLEQQLGGASNRDMSPSRDTPNESPDLPSVRTKIQRMERSQSPSGGRRPAPPPMPLSPHIILPPAPLGPAPPPPNRPPSSVPPVPPPPAPVIPTEPPSYMQQRQERDTFGVHQNRDYNYHPNWEPAESAPSAMSRDSYNDSWGRAESSKHQDDGSSYQDREHMWDQHDGHRANIFDNVYSSGPPGARRSQPTKQTSTERATYRTHMAQRSAQERDRRSSTSTHLTDKHDGMEVDDWPRFLSPSQPATLAVVQDSPEVPRSLPSPGVPAASCLTYNRVPWKLRVRKEVFSPGEGIGPLGALDLLFSQVALDVLGGVPTLRVAPQERRSALALLGGHGVTLDNLGALQGSPRAIVKRHLVDMARGWPLYFARLFVVNGSPQLAEVTLLGVSHSGVFLARRDSGGPSGPYLNVVRALALGELTAAVTLPRPAALQLTLRTGARLTLHAPRAQAIQQMVASYCQEYRQLQAKSSPSRAIQGGPVERIDIAPASPEPLPSIHVSPQHSSPQHVPEVRPPPINVTAAPQPESPGPGKYPLLQFAMQHFRQAPESPMEKDKRGSDWTWRQQTDLVKWQGTPLSGPLLRLPPELGPLAAECFECILRYCGDLPPDQEMTEVKCVYTVLMHCHKHPALRDETYCQLMKQTTSNKSPSPDSCQRAWRLLSVLAAYFGCSDALRPFLLDHLGAAANDRRRSCHGTAAVCLANLRKTARCGGRKNVPSVEEVTAVSAGRSARRQIYRLPGGAERVVNTRCSTVVGDVVAELCALLGVDSPAEQQEFSLYCIVQGDAFTMPLAADEYILDVTTELLKSGQPFYLIFCRSVWHHPLRADPGALYTEVLFNQVAPDYLEGLLLELPGGGPPPPEIVRDVARVAALLHRAADLQHVPSMKEIKFLLPKPALGLRELRPAQWVSLVQGAWSAAAPLAPHQVKAQVLHVLSAWPLFGSSFFAVKRTWGSGPGEVEPPGEVPAWRELILALNRRGVLFLDPNTHETLQHWPFAEVISTRKVRSEDGALFLDMKCGNLLQQRVTRLQTEQAHEISRLVRQYITLAQGPHHGHHHNGQ